MAYSDNKNLIEGNSFSRSPRIIGTLPQGEIEIEAAPSLGQRPEINWLTVIMPSIGMIAVLAGLMLLMPLVMGTNAAFYSPMMFAFSGSMMLISMITAIISYRGQVKKFRQREGLRRRKYEEYLAEKHDFLNRRANEQRAILNGIHLSPEQCIAIVADKKRRLWERMPEDDDFMSIRIGMGAVPMGIKVKTPRVGIVLDEDEYLYSPQRIADEFQMVDGVPIVCDFMHYQGCGVVGRYDLASSLARCTIVQAATNHGYDELRIIGIFSGEHEEDWKWLRFLPHVFDKSHMRRYLSFGQYQSRELLSNIEGELKLRMELIKEKGSGEIKQKIPYYLIVTDDLSLLINQPIMTMMLDRGHEIGVGHIIISDRLSGIHRSTTQIIETKPDTNMLYVKNKGTDYIPFSPDRISIDMCDRFARSMMPIRLTVQEGTDGKLPNQVTFMAGYGIARPNDLDLTDLWGNVRPEESMLVPIAVDSRGETFYFDINEKAHGPHGIVAGTTGSGKSEMIQSWILSMAIQFSPQDVSFVLIDFKGTGLIQPFLRLPHLAGKISDIDTDIGRNLIALRAELQRRKRLFDNAGTNNISGYLKLYRAGKVKEPLSYLFVIIDEYAEFKSNFPDFTAEINSLFRTGRALGVHIILLTQNPMGVISDESESNVNFRWCLKVAGTAASKEILGGHMEAAQITEPGRAYVRVGEDDIFEQVQSFYSGAPYSPDSQRNKVEINKIDISGRRIPITSKEKGFEYGKEIDVLIRYVCDYTEKKHIQPARQIWMEQLPSPIYLSHDMTGKEEQGGLFPVVGLLDDPENQVQYPFTLPLSTEGHVVVHGGPGSGKTTFLQTLIVSLCTKYTPDEVNIYVMDFGSWGMGMFRDFPHVGGVVCGNEDKQIENMMNLLSRILGERKRLFAGERVGSIQSYNRIGKEILPYIVLIVDNFAPIMQTFNQLESAFTEILREGGSYGVYLIATSGTAAGLGYRLQQNVKTKVALQMTDSTDYSSILGKTGGILPKNIAGRGLYRDGKVMEFQTALPASSEDEVERASLIKDMASRQREEWAGKLPQVLKTLPEVIPYGSIPMGEGTRFILGLSINDVEPVSISKEEPHTLLISGTSGSGKTNLLRILIQQINNRSDARIFIYGNKEEYEDVMKQKDVLTNKADVTDEFLGALADELKRRNEDKNNGVAGDWTPIYVVIDGFKACMDGIEQDSLDRMNAIAQIGAGLGVMLVIAENNNTLNPLKGYVPVLNKMATSQVIVLGGVPTDHLFIDSKMIAEGERHKEFEEHDGMLVQAEKHKRIRIMKAGRGE